MPEDLGAHTLQAIRAELRRLRALGDGALAQVTDEAAFHARLDQAESNSIAVLIRHMAGNMRSRWTEFLTTDGEKATRDRDGEFELDRRETREELLIAWRDGWDITLGAVDALTPADLLRTVTVRGESFTALEALLRQLGHYAQHVGQMLMLAKHAVGAGWQSLSIPRSLSTRGSSSHQG
jgi:hypothetical protein